MAKAARKMYARRNQRRAIFDATRRTTGVRRPGSMKKKGKSASTNRSEKRRTV